MIANSLAVAVAVVADAEGSVKREHLARIRINLSSSISRGVIRKTIRDTAIKATGIRAMAIKATEIAGAATGIETELAIAE